MLEADHTRMRIIRELYKAAREGTPEEFVRAFDNFDVERASEVQAWKKIASDAVDCQSPVYVLTPIVRTP